MVKRSTSWGKEAKASVTIAEDKGTCLKIARRLKERVTPKGVEKVTLKEEKAKTASVTIAARKGT